MIHGEPFPRPLPFEFILWFFTFSVFFFVIFATTWRRFVHEIDFEFFFGLLGQKSFVVVEFLFSIILLSQVVLFFLFSRCSLFCHPYSLKIVTGCWMKELFTHIVVKTFSHRGVSLEFSFQSVESRPLLCPLCFL